MSSNIYEDPDWTVVMKHCEGADREERIVNIYEGLNVNPRNGGAAVKRNPYRAASLVLGLLCLLLLMGITLLSQLSDNSDIFEQDAATINACDENNNDSSTKLGIFQMCLQGEKYSDTAREEVQTACYYKSTERKTWTESRGDCQSRGADLVIINSKDEHAFVRALANPGDVWIGLQSLESNGKWKWVDDTYPSYMPWAVGVVLLHVGGAQVYINPDGLWNHTTNGSKHWICEKHIH